MTCHLTPSLCTHTQSDVFIFEDVTSTDSAISEISSLHRFHPPPTPVPSPIHPYVKKWNVRKSSKGKASSVVFDNQSVTGVQDMFIGNFEERRKFGVADIMNTLGIVCPAIVI